MPRHRLLAFEGGAIGSDDGTLPGDAYPFDGLFNITDLNGVRNNFGAGPDAVPEPSAILLALAAIVFGWTTSRHHRRRF